MCGNLDGTTDSKLIIDNCGEAEIRSYLNHANQPTATGSWGDQGFGLNPQLTVRFLFIYELSEPIIFHR